MPSYGTRSPGPEIVDSKGKAAIVPEDGQRFRAIL